MVTLTARNGVTLSASASQNGFPPSSFARKFKVPGMGDFAAREDGRKRRAERRQRLASKSAYLDSRD